MDCLLTISCPASLEEEVIDLLGDHPDWVSGMTALAAEGCGAGTRLHSALEQVRGRSRRRVVQVVIERAHAGALIEALRSQLPSQEIAWWTMPVDGYGRLG